MDTPTTSSRPTEPCIEETSCGVPSIADLLQEGSKWNTNLRSRGLVNASDNTLTDKGKKPFFKSSSKRDWVSEQEDGTVAFDSDFKLALSVVSNGTVGKPDQLRVNDLCLTLALMSCFTENQMKGTGTDQYKSELEHAQKELKEDYQNWYHHLHLNERTKRNPTWDLDYKSFTMRVALSAHTLLCLVMDPEDDTKVQSDLTDSWDPDVAAKSFRATSFESSKNASKAVESHHQEHHSLSNKDPRPTVSRQPAQRERAGLLGGMSVPSGDGRSADVGQKRFPDATKKGGNSAADVLKKKIMQSIRRMAE